MSKVVNLGANAPKLPDECCNNCFYAQHMPAPQQGPAMVMCRRNPPVMGALAIPQSMLANVNTPPQIQVLPMRPQMPVGEWCGEWVDAENPEGDGDDGEVQEIPVKAVAHG